MVEKLQFDGSLSHSSPKKCNFKFIVGNIPACLCFMVCSAGFSMDMQQLNAQPPCWFDTMIISPGFPFDLRKNQQYAFSTYWWGVLDRFGRNELKKIVQS